MVNKINKCIDIFTENVYFRIWLWNGNNKRGSTLHRLDCFDTRSIINTLAIDYWLELKHLILFHSSIPYVSSTLFDNPTQCLIEFENQMIYSILFWEFGFVEWLSCIKLFNLKEFWSSLKTQHSVWYAGYTCSVLHRFGSSQANFESRQWVYCECPEGTSPYGGPGVCPPLENF